MIEVKPTILETIKDKIKKMRFLGQNDPQSLKAVLSLIVIDDLFDWSSYLEDPASVQKYLKDLRTSLIQCNPIFSIQYNTKLYMLDDEHKQIEVTLHSPTDKYYVNVNTPQTESTWKRVWDAPKLDTLDNSKIEPYIPEEEIPTSFTPDPTCSVSMVYFGAGMPIPAGPDGKPKVNIAKLSTCEKMNIYINRETGKTYYLDPATCTWKQMIMGTEGSINWNQIKDAPTIYTGIEHFINEEGDTLTVNLLSEGEPTSDISVMKASEIDDVL